MEEQKRLTMEELNALETFVKKVNQAQFPDNLTEDQIMDGLRLYARFNAGTKTEDIDSKTDQLFNGYLQWIDNPFIEFYEKSKSIGYNLIPLVQDINNRMAHLRSNSFFDR